MPLQLKVATQLGILGETLNVINRTGAYSPSNEGGFGDVNPSLNQSALAVYVERSSLGVVERLHPVSTDELFNNAAANDDETTLEMQFGKDGNHKAYLFYLPVSQNGITTLEGDVISVGQYFYWDGNNANPTRTYQLLASGPAWIANKGLMVGDSSVIQAFCQELIHPALTVKKNDLYKEFVHQRDNGCDDLTPFRNANLDLGEDLKGASASFYSGLTTEAERQINNLLEKHGLQ